MLVTTNDLFIQMFTQMSNLIIDKTKIHFLEKLNQSPLEVYDLQRHVEQVEIWANKILNGHPEINNEIVLTSVWLHDIGKISGNENIDHAVNSEKEAIIFLKSLNVDKSTITAVAHCVRAHRCKDVLPETSEAKLLAAADSFSHMTYYVYILFATEEGPEAATAKLERDIKDLDYFPEFINEIKPLYSAWKSLLVSWPSL